MHFNPTRAPAALPDLTRWSARVTALLLLLLAAVAQAQERPRNFPETYRSPTAPAPGVLERLPATELQCVNALQGKVAWNRVGSTQWAQSQMLLVCEGTRYADIRVECFRRQVALHDDWQLGVLACRTAEQSLRPQRFKEDSSGFLLAHAECVGDALRQPAGSQEDELAQCAVRYKWPADPPEKAVDGVLPPLSVHEQDCMSALQDKVQRHRGSIFNTVDESHWLESSLRKVCDKTPNPTWTVDCVKQQFTKGNPEATVTAFCNTATQAKIGFTVPAPARPATLTRTTCREIVQCMLDTTRSFSPADVCDACNNGVLSAADKVRTAIESVSVASTCAAANEIKWLKDTIVGGPVAALSLTLCQLGYRSTTSLDQYCQSGCASQCEITYNSYGKPYDACMLSCGCNVGKFVCESVTSYAAEAACKGFGLP